MRWYLRSIRSHWWSKELKENYLVDCETTAKSELEEALEESADKGSTEHGSLALQTSNTKASTAELVPKREEQKKKGLDWEKEEENATVVEETIWLVAQKEEIRSEGGLALGGRRFEGSKKIPKG